MQSSSHSLPISVVLPVYNASRHLREALDSVLAQTFTDFEVLAINDGSTDNSLEILRSYSDERIKIIENKSNLGLVETLNKGIAQAKGKYVARMDADDICLPDRFAKQYEYLEAHPDIGVVGAWVEVFDEEGQVSKWELATKPDDIYVSMLFRTALIHPSVMMRTSLFQQEGFSYSLEAKHVEDYDLWCRMLPNIKMANLPEVQLRYRISQQGISASNVEVQRKGTSKIRIKLLNKLGINPSDKDMKVHRMIGYKKFSGDVDELKSIDNWMANLMRANKQFRQYSGRALNEYLYSRWKEAFLEINASSMEKKKLVIRSMFLGKIQKFLLLFK